MTHMNLLDEMTESAALDLDVQISSDMAATDFHAVKGPTSGHAFAEAADPTCCW
ncbi:hypothetical protein [Streptomyces sp. I05A-00742]|uniref:hypothetical protein n=1 Tax=Streptomyces sp. I05A-00742 TaxID=2732853 RepID=UPI001489A06C|nr:hypothetical protein [Streptomyces sp. I05A-00742]